MPYFRKEGWLFIHIPKTGGSSLERYFSKKFDVPLNEDSLCYHCPKTQFFFGHLTCRQILQNKDEHRISPFIKIITIVRNPYERAVSNLFYRRLIRETNTKDEVFEIFSRYVTGSDIHILPQYRFLTDANDTVIPTIHILRTETLNEDMHKIGFTDFNDRVNANPETLNYYDYLNDDSIKLINELYAKDFELFGYVKIK